MEDETQNEYLKLRKAKIARNEARLAELGLLKKGNPIMELKQKSVSVQSSPLFSNNNSQKQTNNDNPKSIPMPLRRSSRRTNRPESYQEVPKDTTIGKVRIRSTMIGIKEEAKVDDQDTNYTPPPAYQIDDNTLVSLPSRKKRAKQSLSSSSSTVSKVNSRSVRLLYLHVERLLIKADMLGRVMAHTGKAHVIEEAAEKAVCITYSSDSFRGGGSLSFNKYCGVQEWYNDAIFLWVNIGSPQSDVVNEFLDHGRKMTWYGGSSMHDESKQILNLLRVGQNKSADTTFSTTTEGGANNKQEKKEHDITTNVSNVDGDKETSSSRSSIDISNGDGIVLWCRQYQRKTKAFGPYTCLGRLGYDSHVPNSRPIKFVWKLLDYDRLVQHADIQVQETFQAIQALANHN